MIPQNFEEFRESLLDDLHRAAFDTPVELFFGIMNGPCFEHEKFGQIEAKTYWLPSFDYADIRDSTLTKVGLDLLTAKKKGKKEFHMWLYQVPEPNQEVPFIRYAIHFI